MTSPSEQDETYTSMEVTQMLGVSYRQLDYWVRRGLITGIDVESVGSGHYRRWTRDQLNRIEMLRTASELHNMPLEVLAEAIETGQVTVRQ